MTGKTHRAGGMVCAAGGYLLLSHAGMLEEGVSPILQLALLYPFCMWGSVMSDLDQNWNSCPSKDIVSLAFHGVLHLGTRYRNTVDDKHLPKGFIYHFLGLFDAKHRSWQTHSDVLLFLFCLLLYGLKTGKLFPRGSLNGTDLSIMFTGVTLGLLAHLSLDMLTPEGIWSLPLCLLKKVFKLPISGRFHLVPHVGFFATDGPWETVVRFMLWTLSVALFSYIIALQFGMKPLF